MFRIVPILIAAALTLLPILPASAQGTKPAPTPGRQAASDPARPYKPVAVTLPVEVKDAAFEAFRKQLGDVARKKDRAALGRLVIAKGFFWERGSGDSADKKKSGVDNLAVALGLANKDAVGWDMLAGYADDPTASTALSRKGAICSPADPGFNDKDMAKLLETTQSDPSEWAYPLADSVEVRERPQASAPVADKLGLHFVRVAPDSSPAAAVGSFLRIVTPAGKYGYVANDNVAPLGNDQICYVKDGGAWKIGGYVGAGDAN